MFTEFPGDDVVATGNLVLYAKMTTLAVNSKLCRAWRAEQQEAIRGAADASATWSITHHATEADGAEKFCGIGGTIVDPDDQQYSGVRRCGCAHRRKGTPGHIDERVDR